MAQPLATPTPEQIEELFHKASTDHDSRVPLIFAVEIPVLVLTISVVALRFYARTHIKKTLGKDDWVMGGAAFFAIVLTTLNCVATRFGAGQHLWDFDIFARGIIGGKLAYVYAVLFTPAVVLCKMSICMTYLRIFPKRTDRLFAKGVIWWLAITGIGCTVAMIVPCIPVEAYWDITIRDKKCYNARRALIITSSLNTVTDLAVFLWPAPRLFSLRLPLSQRLGLIFVFSIGCLTCAAGIGRIWFIGRHYYRSQDIFYNLAVLYVLSSLDCNLAILCGSLPEVRTFLAPAFDKIFRRRKSLSSSHHQRGGSTSTGKLPPNAYDLEKSTRPRPDLDDLRDDEHDYDRSAEDSRQVSINVMLDEGSYHNGGSGRSRSGSHNGGGGGANMARTVSNKSSRSAGGAARHTIGHFNVTGASSQPLSPNLSLPGRRAEVTESKFSA